MFTLLNVPINNSCIKISYLFVRLFNLFSKKTHFIQRKFSTSFKDEDKDALQKSNNSEEFKNSRYILDIPLNDGIFLKWI